MRLAIWFALLSIPASGQITPLISLNTNASSQPALLSHTIFGCTGGALATCTSGSGVAQLPGSAINTTGASLIVISFLATLLNGEAGHGVGDVYTVTDSASNAWSAFPSQHVSNSVLFQMVYVLSPSTSASHTFTITAADTTIPSWTVEVAAYSNANFLTGYAANVAATVTSIQPGSVTPASNSVDISSAGFRNTSGFTGNAPTVNSGFTVRDSTAANATGQFWAAGLADIIGSTSPLNPTWSITGQSNTPDVAAFSSVFSASAGSTGTVPTLRGSGAVTSSNSSYTLNWPAGTASGDLAIVMCGHGFSCTQPTGWTTLDSQVGSNWNGAVFTKVLNGTDISTGHVVVTTGGSFDGYLSIATFVGAPTATLGFSFRSAGTIYTNSTLALASGAVVTAGSYCLYFLSNRAVSTNTVTHGSQLQQGNDASGASGALYSQSFTTGIGSAPVFNLSVYGSGYYGGQVCVH